MRSGEQIVSLHTLKRLKIPLLGLAVAALVLVGFVRWQHSPKRLESLAFREFEKGFPKEAYEKVGALQNKIPLPQFLLYQAYALRQSELINRSNQRLAEGIKSFDPKLSLGKKEQKLALEISLNQALNGYLSNKESLLEEGLERASRFEPNNPWIFLFQAVRLEKEGRFVEASALAEKAVERDYLSPWMRQAFSSVFDKNCIDFLRIRALITLGKNATAQIELNKLIQQNSLQKTSLKNPSYWASLTLLEALNQLQEAQKQPLDSSLPYFKLAYALIEKIDPHTRLFKENSHYFAMVFAQQGEKILQKGGIEGIGFYMQALHKWGATIKLEALATLYSDWLCDREIAGERPESLPEESPQLEAFLHSQQWRDILYTTLTKRIEKILSEKRWDQIARFWSTQLMFSQTNPELVQTVTRVLEKEIGKCFERFLKESAAREKGQNLGSAFFDLHQLLPLLAHMESDPGKYQLFLETLLDQAAVLLLPHTIPPAADDIFLMLLDSSQAAQPEKLRLRLKEFLKKRFWQARNMQETETMARLFDICTKVNVQALPSYSPEAIANMIADAQFMLGEQKIKSAHDQLLWVLKIDPKNRRACQLLAYSYFSCEEFDKAAPFFEKMEATTGAIPQLLAICYLKIDAQTKAFEILSQLQASGQLVSDRLKLEIALVYARQNLWREALGFWKTILQKNSDIWTYILVAEYKLGEVKEVWQTYQQLPQSIQANSSLTALVLRSAQKHGLWGLADTILERATALPADPTPLGERTHAFLKEQFPDHEIDLSLAAAHYFQESKQNPNLALAMLAGKESNHWRILTERAKALIQIGSYQEAYNQLLKKSADLAIEEESIEYWLVKSRVLRLQGYLAESKRILDSIEKTLGPRYPQIDLERVFLMLAIKRPDCARTLLEKIVEPTSSFEELSLLADLSIQQSAFEEGSRWLELASQKESSPWRVWQLALLRWPLEEHQAVALELPSKNLFEQLTGQQKAWVLQKMMATGFSALAKNWIEKREGELGESFEAGLVTMQLSLLEKDLPRAEALLEELIERRDRTVEQSMELAHWLELLSKEALLKKWSEQIPLDLESPCRIDAYASALPYLTLGKVCQKKRGVLDPILHSNIQKIFHYTEGSRRKEEGPLYDFWFHAAASLLLTEKASADSDLDFCQIACSSFIDPYIEAAAILKDSKSPTLALDPLHLALKLHPRNPWIQTKIAEVAFELHQRSHRSEEPTLLEQSQCLLSLSLAAAPYLFDSHLLAGRIAAFREEWSIAQEAFTDCLLLDSENLDLLHFLQNVLKKRIEKEGFRLEWSQKLHEIDRHLAEKEPISASFFFKSSRALDLPFSILAKG